MTNPYDAIVFWRRVLLRQTNKYINAHWGGGEIDGTTGNDKPSRSIMATFQKKCAHYFVHFLLIQHFN